MDKEIDRQSQLIWLGFSGVIIILSLIWSELRELNLKYSYVIFDSVPELQSNLIKLANPIHSILPSIVFFIVLLGLFWTRFRKYKDKGALNG